MSFSLDDSVTEALGLVTLRDQNPELSRSVYGTPTNTSPSEISEDNKSPSKPSTSDQSLSETPIPVQSDNNEEVDYNFISSKQIDPSILFLIPSIYPPNNGNQVSNIDDLVDPQEMGNMMSMFSSVPDLQPLIDPGKFTKKPGPEPKVMSSAESVESVESKTEITDYDDIVTTSSGTESPRGKLCFHLTDCIINIITPDFDSVKLEPKIDLSLITDDRDEIKQNWSILDISMNATPKGWLDVFRAAISEIRRISRDLDQDVREHGHFFPLRKNLFKAFDICPLDAVKVVIIGQDPYHSTDHNGYPDAMGMSFSVGRENRIPSSLQNIYKEVGRSIPDWRRPNHGDLTDWSKQGVLMMNTCLTVRPHKAKSHGGLWMGFISKVITAIGEKNPQCIYVLWGKEAEKVTSQLSNKNIILATSHPSGFSAHRGFVGCDHFVKINQELQKQGRRPIDWSL